MLIWGIRQRQKVLDKGTFFCPKCNQNRAYKRKRAGKYFSLYFIPLLKVKNLGEYVECQVCHSAYDPGILDRGSQDTLQLVASTRYALLHGTHPSAARSQLLEAGTDARTADRIIEMAQK
jgi:hypothetical protein